MVTSSPPNWAVPTAAKAKQGALCMTLCVRLFRRLAPKAFVLALALLGATVGTIAASQPVAAQNIIVEGNRRVEAETIRSYFRTGSGERLDSAKIDEALKALYASGLFQDVQIRPGPGGRVTVVVV